MAAATFHAATLRVRVPATSANLGPGYDSFGLALSLWDEIEVSVAERGLALEVSGEGADSVGKDASNLVVTAMNTAFDYLGGRPPGVAMRCLNRIPHGRGLGSSAAAVVGGLCAARALTVGGDERIDDDRLLALATEVEGHPDNAAAAIHGGFTVAWTDGSGASSAGVLTGNPHDDVRPVAFIPDVELRTAEARRVLPDSVPHRDAAVNSSRAALLARALIERPDLLMVATEDLLHQNYRRPVMSASLSLMDDLRASGVPAVISGAGPSVLALTRHSEAGQVAAEPRPGWRVEVLDVARGGVDVTRVT